jgi:predicted metal-dependent peptidase
MTSKIKIERARWWALSNPAAVFYGSLATHLVDVLDESVPTAATDGKRILWNPAFLESLTDEEVRFVLLHEALHCVYGHFWRLPLTDDGNRAGDYAINRILAGIPGISMPKGGLLDPRFDGLAEEEILAALGRTPQPQPGNGKPSPQPGKGAGKPQPGAGQPGNGKPQPGKGAGKPQPGASDPGGCGGFIAPDTTPNPNGQTLREKWEGAVLQGEFLAKSLGQGNLPADLARIVQRVRAVEVNWRQELADWTRSIVADRADWSRSSRRHATAPCIYPRRKRDQLGTIVVVRDTSGSIDKALCDEFSAQVTQFSADLRCKVVVLDCDTRIHAEYHLEPGDECPLDARGGGGTDFEPAFDRVAQLLDEGETIAGLVYLTDLDGKFPADPEEYPVLWAAYNTTGAAPFGRTIHVKK